MLDRIFYILGSLLAFGSNSLGSLRSPYATYRRIVYEKSKSTQTVYIWLFALSYFVWVSAIRNGIRNPILLTFKLNVLLIAGIIGFCGSLFFLYFFGKKIGGKGGLKSFYILWSYSLLPTIVWFFLTSVIYLVLPPPRTLSIGGKLFSVLFVSLSIAILIWKIVLYYLTLRFGLKLELIKISLISFVYVPLVFLYSILMYRLGIFRIPFI